MLCGHCPKEAVNLIVTICLDAATLRFYGRIAAQLDLSVEQVLSDALFKLAGELSLEAMKKVAPEEL